MDPDEIMLLLREVWDVHREYTFGLNQSSLREPTVLFTHDTDETFRATRSKFLHNLKTTKNGNGNSSYIPHYDPDDFNYDVAENVVKQWHSVESVWQLMESKATDMNINYTRVGMFRSDVLFVTPMDIFMKDSNTTDTENRSSGALSDTDSVLPFVSAASTG